jgi:cytochrome P450
MSETTQSPDGESARAPEAGGDAGQSRAPGPDGLPVLGNVHSIADDAFAFYEGVADEYGGVARYEVFGTEAYLLTDPETIREVLVDDHGRYVKGEMPREQLGSLLGEGLFLSEGEQWRSQRDAVRSAFFRERIEAYGDAMVENARETADAWGDGDVVDVHEASTDYAFSVLAESLLGDDVDAARGTVRDAAASITERFDTSRLSSFLPEWVPTPTRRRYHRRLDALRETIRDVVAERRAGDPPANPAEADDLLGTLVAAAELGAIDDDELVDNAVTFLFAGHETSALGLTYTLYGLADRPEMQDRIRDEVAALDDGLTPAGIRDCPTLSAAVDEALRWHPPVHTFFREPTEPVTLGGYDVPAGVVLNLSPWTVHHDERWWDEPERYRPERWLRETDDGRQSPSTDETDDGRQSPSTDETDDGRQSPSTDETDDGVVHGDDTRGPAVGERPEYSYFPFGGGPRHCIGMRFARQELRLATATLLRRFEFERVTEPLSLQASANTRPAHPVRLRVRETSPTSRE